MTNLPGFTKEQLEKMAAVGFAFGDEQAVPGNIHAQLAAFAFRMMAERDEAREDLEGCRGGAAVGSRRRIELEDRIKRMEQMVKGIQIERDEARRELAEAEEALRYVVHGDGYDAYRSEPTNVLGYTGTGGVWFPFPGNLQPAVRRAINRAVPPHATDEAERSAYAATPGGVE